MTDVDDLVSAFSAKSDDAKIEDFEQSSLSLVMKQLGASHAFVRNKARELGPEFSFEWFNAQDILGPWLSATRVFDYNLPQILKAPTRNPLVKMFEEQRALAGIEEEAVYVIFKCHDVGRMIATNVKLADTTHIHVAVRDTRFNIVPFRGFFSERYGQVIIQE